jgi:cell wall-associated NlpC family hydrolase
VVQVAALAVVAVLAGGCATGGARPRPFPEPASGGVAPPAAAPPAAGAVEPAPPLALDVIGTALTFLGTPYRNGGSDPSGFDCSGFVQYVYGRNGIALPRSVGRQFGAGRDVAGERLRAGDLLFFATTGAGATHVGVALGDGRFVHAPSSRGTVRVESLGGAYWATKIVGVRRVIEP